MVALYEKLRVQRKRPLAPGIWEHTDIDAVLGHAAPCPHCQHPVWVNVKIETQFTDQSCRPYHVFRAWFSVAEADAQLRIEVESEISEDLNKPVFAARTNRLPRAHRFLFPIAHQLRSLWVQVLVLCLNYAHTQRSRRRPLAYNRCRVYFGDVCRVHGAVVPC